MKKVIRKFQCDVCAREELISNGGEKYPFSKGWFRLDAIDMGIPLNSNHSVVDQDSEMHHKDKDFCSKNCFYHFLDGEIDDKSNAVNVFEKQMKDKELNKEVYPKSQEQLVQSPLPPHSGFSELSSQENKPVREEVPKYSESLSNFENVDEPKKKKGWFGRK